MANQTLVRHVNERRLLAALRLEGPQPRAALARRLSLTRAAISDMVEDLLSRGLVVEIVSARTRGRRDVGRPGIDLGLRADGAFFLGAEIGVGVLRLALSDLAGTIVDTRSLPLGPADGPARVVALMAESLVQFGARAAYRGRIRAVGVTVPGLVRRDGHVVNLPILGWRDVPLARLLAEALAVPVHLANNANAAAFGHIHLKARAPGEVSVYLKLGTGCGGAVIDGDRLVRGADGLGTEFGHIPIAPSGPACHCGQSGCLETFVNIRALQRYFAHEEVDEQEADLTLPARVAERAAAGDPAARGAIETIAQHLLQGLVIITNIFNPSEIILGGAMLPILPALAETLEDRLANRIVPGMTRPRIVVSRLGPFECAIGAAAMAHHEEFDLSNVDLAG
ncbi:ROK family transcriptional regulator [Arsenicitalea aurantiaca]|uniref:ROK family transcriptional regulator n=1 Tax=Arsenicitalea aurantiaca TaxID=1783274 RepID=A0A433XB86_9HYPH|nr:ROK family transcriptional regulator [Arsenicitalea aurantiaca]RUT31361.1 ROK family transcriptional regulator [Arsenicitalea aurantiaca]